MLERFHVKVTIKDGDEKQHSYIYEGVNFKNIDEAIKAGKNAFQNTPQIIMVEVFQYGVAQAIKIFQ